MSRTMVVFLLLFIVMGTSYPQSISVIGSQQITELDQGAFFYPQFGPAGKNILMTQSGFKGLALYNLETEELRVLNEEAGAGYEPVFINNGQSIVYRTQIYKNRRKFYEIKMYNVTDGQSRVLETEGRNISTPRYVLGQLLWMVDQNMVRETVQANLQQPFANRNQPVCFIEGGSILVFESDQRRELKPLGEGNYIWPSISPEGDRIVFTKAGAGTFIADLEGNIIREIGYANAPQWSPDGNWILFMDDKDDGHRITDSELGVFSVETAERIQLTDTDDEIELYPRWDPQGKRVVFASDRGEIFLINLNRE